MNIILVHGILGFKKIGNVYYFNELKEYLEEKHRAKVLVPELDPTASIEERGNQLRSQILDALGVTGKSPYLKRKDETHIIAHSMGGLDCRFILSPKNPRNIAKYITSLTTVATLHRGTPLADLLYPFFDGKSPIPIFALGEKLLLKSLHGLGISELGLFDLTSEKAAIFDKDYIDDQGVRYFWTAGIGRNSFIKTSWPLLLSYMYIKRLAKNFDEETNDGAVPLASASHGEAIGDLWYADHFDVVGHDLNRPPLGKPKNFNYLEKYDQIISRISSLRKPSV
ncbi:MAG: esterase/lipase family protein [Gammaproteobacteria bacterium]